jgi:glycopeptide antibiotics resistance protein
MMVHFFPYPFLIGLITAFFILIILGVRGKPTYRLIINFVSWAYFLVVIGLTIFPIPYFADLSGLKASDQISLVFSRINWVPFYNWGGYSGRSQLFEIVNNILLTIPFGFLINFFVKLNWKNILWVSIASGLAIETSQFIMSLFFGPYRTVDINDVILNTMGSLIGYLLFITTSWIFHKPGKLTQKKK